MTYFSLKNQEWQILSILEIIVEYERHTNHSYSLKLINYTACTMKLNNALFFVLLHLESTLRV